MTNDAYCNQTYILYAPLNIEHDIIALPKICPKATTVFQNLSKPSVVSSIFFPLLTDPVLLRPFISLNCVFFFLNGISLKSFPIFYCVTEVFLYVLHPNIKQQVFEIMIGPSFKLLFNK